MITTWQTALDCGKECEELLLSFDQARDRRILILPALFDEANKMRRLTVQVMRRMDVAGIDSFLPDLPGCNESLAPLKDQTLSSWRKAVEDAATQVGATHTLAIRAGALLAPFALPGWQYAPQNGPKLLRSMLRAKIIAEREAGRDTSSEQLMSAGLTEGLTLNGWPIGAPMLKQLETAEISHSAEITTIEQKSVGGAGLWLRAEPDEDSAQADALTSLICDQQAQTT